MNYLVHLYLSDPEPLCQLGNLMGDFVKGRLVPEAHPPAVLSGLRQHRAVDRISQEHPAVRRSKKRLDDRFGHTKSILVDIFYDHLLAKHWPQWGQGTLEAYTGAAYRLLKENDDLLVPEFRPVVQRMIDRDWLTQYRHPETIKITLKKIGQRLKRANRLAEGYVELERCSQDMADDCSAFLASTRIQLDGDRSAGVK